MRRPFELLGCLPQSAVLKECRAAFANAPADNCLLEVKQLLVDRKRIETTLCQMLLGWSSLSCSWLQRQVRLCRFIGVSHRGSHEIGP